jgi:hypothetical protein
MNDQVSCEHTADVVSNDKKIAIDTPASIPLADYLKKRPAPRQDNLAEADYSQAWSQERKDMMSDLYEGTTKRQDTKDAMSAAAKARVARGDTPPDRSKACFGEGVLYKSRVEAAKALGCNPVTVMNRINAGKNGYKWA